MKICKFCQVLHTKVNICSRQYCYEYIFTQFLKNILLDYKPKNLLEFNHYAMRKIIDNNLFIESPDPFVIMRENLEIFIQDYDWL